LNPVPKIHSFQRIILEPVPGDVIAVHELNDGALERHAITQAPGIHELKEMILELAIEMRLYLGKIIR